MAIDNFRCPSCGADVSYSGEEFGECPYCGSQLHFGELADAEELRKLRSENSEYARQDRVKAEYRKKLKNWTRTKWWTFIAIGVVNMISFVLLSFDYIGVGATLFLFAGIGFLLAPAFLGATFPCLDEEKCEIVYGRGKKLKKILALYGTALTISVLSIIIAAVISMALGYESDEEKEAKKKASEFNYAAEYLGGSITYTKENING